MVALLEHEDSSLRLVALQALRVQPRLSDECLEVVVALLKDEGRHIRAAALEVLGTRPSLSNEHLEAVVALLKDKTDFVELSALRVLGAQYWLSEEHLAAVIALLLEGGRLRVKLAALDVVTKKPGPSRERLETVMVALLQDEDDTIRLAALRALKTRLLLLDEYPTLWPAVAALLEDEDDRVRSAAAALSVMKGHYQFFTSLLNGPSAGSLLKVLLPRSFEEQCSWHVDGRTSWVTTPEGSHIPLIDDMEGFKNTVVKSWPRGIPLEKASQAGQIWE